MNKLYVYINLSLYSKENKCHFLVEFYTTTKILSMFVNVEIKL